MKVRSGRTIRISFLAIICLYVFSSLTAFAASRKSTSGSKIKLQGIVVSRDGDLVKLQEKESGSVRDIQITDSTKIQRSEGLFDRKTMGVNAVIPGLAVKVEGIANAEGRIEARKLHLKPDAFEITVAQQQEILDNRAAAGHAQASADEGIANAGAAQSSADHAQATANQGLSTAQSATAISAANMTAIGRLNQRVSDLGEYTTVASVAVYFREGSYQLDKTSKATLDQLVAANSNLNGYVLEVIGYTDSTGSRHVNQTLSEKRAAAVAQHLREEDNVPASRFATPAGYGETHPAVENTDSKARAMNRRVEVRVLVSKGLLQSAPVALGASNR